MTHTRTVRGAGGSACRALVMAWAVAACAQAAIPQITAVRFWSLGEVTRIAIETDSEATYHAERIDSPERIFLDLSGVRRQAGTRGLQVIPVGDRLVKQIRIALAQPGVVRVVLDLAAPVEYSISQLTNPDRIIIELRLAGAGPPIPPARSVTGSHTLIERAPEPAATPAAAKPAETPRAKLQPTPVPPLKIEPSTAVTETVTPKRAERVVRIEPPSTAPESVAPKRAESAPVKPQPAPLATTRAAAPERTEMASTPRIEEVATKAEPSTPVVKPQPIAPPTPTPEPVRRSAPAASTETAMAAKRDSHGDRSLIRALGLKLDRVVIDPGHGGHDTGTIGPGGLMEKDLVLDVARRLGEIITRKLGSEVVFTRTDDTFIPLEERTQIANDKKADLFLSIHANSSQLPRIAGSETFYLNFTTSADALEVAARENATSATSIHELQTLVQKITLNEKVQESRELASIIQRALYANLPRNRSYKNRGIKKAPFVVLIGAQMPSVLAEIAFLSNPKDESLLKRPEYRQRVAEALYRGVAQYSDALSHMQVARQRRPESQGQ